MLDRVNLIIKNSQFIELYSSIEEAESQRIFCNHNLDHLLSVARIMVIKNLEDNTNLFNKDILYATALLHDLGRSKQYSDGLDHNIAGGVIARDILNDCNYSSHEIKIISEAIENHNNAECTDYLTKLLQYADHKSRNCFLCSVRDKCNWSSDKLNKGIEI